MFGAVKQLFGMSGESAGNDRRHDALTDLEKAVLEQKQDVVDRAAQLRNELRRHTCSPNHEEKVRILKALNKAKVRALMEGTRESYSVFRCLNSITSDVVQLL